VWPSTLACLCLVGAGVVTGWVNTLAGAGGLVAIPALLFSGLSPHAANGTLRLAIIAQSVVGAAAFRRADRLPGKPLWTILPIVVAGGAIGTVTATRLSASTLHAIEMTVLVVMSFGLLVSSTRFVPKEEAAPGPLTPLVALGLLLTGCYGGLIQAGVGLLLLAVLSGMMRFDLIRGNAIKLMATLAFNLVSVVIFALAGQVEWRRGALMSVGSALGAFLAVRFALTRGQQAIRWVLIIAVLAAVAALLWRSR
jgi:uncharacterized protein